MLYYSIFLSDILMDIMIILLLAWFPPLLKNKIMKDIRGHKLMSEVYSHIPCLNETTLIYSTGTLFLCLKGLGNSLGLLQIMLFLINLSLNLLMGAVAPASTIEPGPQPKILKA